MTRPAEWTPPRRPPRPASLLRAHLPEFGATDAGKPTCATWWDTVVVYTNDEGRLALQAGGPEIEYGHRVWVGTTFPSVFSSCIAVELDEIAVDPEFQGREIGPSIVSRPLAAAADLGATHVEAGATEDSERWGAYIWPQLECVPVGDPSQPVANAIAMCDATDTEARDAGIFAATKLSDAISTERVRRGGRLGASYSMRHSTFGRFLHPCYD